ncbi:hypothetical protein PLICRDRAFT_107809, partial [Plicaturopsis crispa FD-325 SS-3]
MEESTNRYWAASHRPPTLNVEISPGYRKKLIAAYKKDATFRDRWMDPSTSSNVWHAGKRYYKDDEGLLYFRDADFKPRLCIPKSEQPAILREMHESPLSTAHAG